MSMMIASRGGDDYLDECRLFLQKGRGDAGPLSHQFAVGPHVLLNSDSRLWLGGAARFSKLLAKRQSPMYADRMPTPFCSLLMNAVLGLLALVCASCFVSVLFHLHRLTAIEFTWALCTGLSVSLWFLQPVLINDRMRARQPRTFSAMQRVSGRVCGGLAAVQTVLFCAVLWQDNRFVRQTQIADSLLRQYGDSETARWLSGIPDFVCRLLGLLHLLLMDVVAVAGLVDGFTFVVGRVASTQILKEAAGQETLEACAMSWRSACEASEKRWLGFLRFGFGLLSLMEGLTEEEVGEIPFESLEGDDMAGSCLVCRAPMELLLCALPGCLHCFHRRCIESELCAVAACPSCSLPVRVVAEQLRLHRMREMQETVSPPCASASGGGALKRAGGYSQPSTCRRVQDVEARNEDREERGEAVSEIASEDARWSSAFSICSTEMSSMAVTSSRGAKGASARESKDFVSGVCGHVQGVGQEGRRGREQESTTDGQWNHLLGADRSQGVHLLYESGQTAATGSYGQRLEESLAGNSGGRVGLLTSSLTGTSA